MEVWSLLSVWWFMFFLLIIAVWYIFVEIICVDRYIFKKQLEKYKSNLFDRNLHYIVWWLIFNVFFIYLCFFTWQLGNIIKVFNWAWQIVQIFYNPNTWNSIFPIQVLIFWVCRFCLILFFLILLLLVSNIFLKINKLTFPKK